MTYKGFKIEKKFDFRINKKVPSIYYGRPAYFVNNKIAKAVIDWIIESDYSRNDNVMGPAYWKYQDELKNAGY